MFLLGLVISLIKNDYFSGAEMQKIGPLNVLLLMLSILMKFFANSVHKFLPIQNRIFKNIFYLNGVSLIIALQAWPYRIGLKEDERLVLIEKSQDSAQFCEFLL